MTNTEAVTKLMDYSRRGPMMQLFILTAIEKYAEQVLEDQDGLIKGWKNGLIHPESWIGCAFEAQEKLNEHLKG